MTPYPFVNDALWRCLCPRFSPNPLSSLTVLSTARPSVRSSPRPSSSSRFTRQLCAYQSSNTQLLRDGIAHPQFNALPSFHTLNTPTKLSRKPKESIPFSQLSNQILYERMRDEGEKGHFNEVFRICRVLVKDRGERLNKDMYTAILHSFVDANNGTAGKLRKVLEEMGFWSEIDNITNRQWKIELDARACECVLEVLAVHPDHLLRAEIMDYMKSRWYTLSDRGRNFIVAGMLRERHFEQALEQLEEMVKNKIRVEKWLFDQTLWTLLEYGEVEEAFYVLSLKDSVQRQGSTGGRKLNSSALWSALLDSAAQKQLHGAVNLIWTLQVQTRYLKPSTGTCLSVLALASRHGHVHLATDVFRLLTERETVLDPHNYELLAAAYLNADDLAAALSVILIMVDANLKVDAGTCQPLYWYLCKEKEGDINRPMTAFNMLQDFEVSGRKIPSATVNACIQASISLKRFEEAIEIYKALHTVSHSGPDTQTFNILLRGCYIHSRKELAMFLVNEMIQLGLKPDRLTYDRLILVCLQAGDVEDALLYYEEMRTVNAKSGTRETFKPRRGTWETLIGRCVANGDERAVALLRDYQQDTPEPRKGVAVAVNVRFKDGRTANENATSDLAEEPSYRI